MFRPLGRLLKDGGNPNLARKYRCWNSDCSYTVYLEVSMVGWDASLCNNEFASPWMFANEGGVVYGVRLSLCGVKD